MWDGKRSRFAGRFITKTHVRHELLRILSFFTPSINHSFLAVVYSQFYRSLSVKGKGSQVACKIDIDSRKIKSASVRQRDPAISLLDHRHKHNDYLTTDNQ